MTVIPTPTPSGEPDSDQNSSVDDATSAADTSPVPHRDGLPASTDRADDQTTSGRRRIWPWAIAGVLTVGTGAGVASYALSDDAVDDDPAPTIRAVTAETRDLVEFDDLDARLGFAQTQILFATARPAGAQVGATAAAPTSAIVTAIAPDGAMLERGDVVVELNAQPTVVFYGTLPFYRDLTQGDQGDDVATLEANLASLGYHLDLDSVDADDSFESGGIDRDGNELDTGFVVDGVYDDATADAVRRWQADFGVEETGEFRLGDAVVVSGPAVVTNPRVEVGSVAQTGAPLIDLNPTSTVHAYYNSQAGEIELEVASGPVETGQVLLTRDDRPVTAVVTAEEFDRDLSEGDEGADVEIIEEMLVALGYDARGDLLPDDEFDDITTEAVEDWEEDLQDRWEELDIDGVVSLDELAIIDPSDFDGPVAVGAVTTRVGDGVAAGSELFTWSSGELDSRSVITSIPVTDQNKLPIGGTVEIEFPDGSVSSGTVIEVASSSTVDPTDPNAEAELEVTIAPAEIPTDLRSFNELDVTVKVVEELEVGATVVPASAILSTPDGDYAVEVVDPDTGDTSLVTIEPGMFTDGFVAVNGIDPGTAVVVPS